jgi:STAS-like domain of unknown function (DUF4325)
MPVTISKWGSELSGRTLGELARAEIEEELARRPAGPLEINLDGVSAMSTSFADECFGALVRKMRDSTIPRTHLRFTGGTSDVRTVIRAVVTSHDNRVHA